MWSRNRYFLGKNKDNEEWYIWGDRELPDEFLLTHYEPLLGPFKQLKLAQSHAYNMNIETIHFIK